ncbi:hypothetical protein [Marivita hallyeonensis]|uniref:Uncharacterized protein n=1 Tax=Marivita hallyeonensis TaxID=996342 RepID=A0A1M5Y6Q3_9RHOB|nr:hypothetical protein [Marivita hallyeonensis]SHI07599.1 hypothetical protein SAMN05443551_0120 [Marivita hallyeonensis]
MRAFFTQIDRDQRLHCPLARAVVILGRDDAALWFTPVEFDLHLADEL